MRLGACVVLLNGTPAMLEFVGIPQQLASAHLSTAFADIAVAGILSEFFLCGWRFRGSVNCRLCPTSKIDIGHPYIIIEQ